jgi:hypothetical protein
VLKFAISPRCWTLPRTAPAHVLRYVVEPAVTADDEDVIVGDGAEGLVAHANIL